MTTLVLFLLLSKPLKTHPSIITLFKTVEKYGRLKISSVLEFERFHPDLILLLRDHVIKFKNDLLRWCRFIKKFICLI